MRADSEARRELGVNVCRPQAHAVEIEVNYRGRIKRQCLASDEAADDRDSQRPPQF